MKLYVKIYEILFCVFCMWYFLPISRVFFSGYTWNLIFFSIEAISILMVALRFCKVKRNRKLINLLLPIIAYMIIFFIFTIFGWKDSNAHIRISFMFWSIFLFYFFQSPDIEGIKRISKFLLLLFFITYITTFVAVLTDIKASRAISYANNEDAIKNIYLLKNVANVYFIQMTVLLVPFAIYFIKNKNCKKKYRIFSMIFLLIEPYFLILSSFTISLLLFLIIFIISIITIYANDTKKRILLILLFMFLMILVLHVIDWVSILRSISNSIDNRFISERINSIISMISGSSATGDVGLREKLYLSSIKTFIHNPLGIGPNYSYINFDEGIGHHSQLFDDMARYGIAAIAFYSTYIISYGKLLYEKYKKFKIKGVVLPITITYLLMLTFNIGFRSSYESVFILFILPAFMDVIEKRCFISD